MRGSDVGPYLLQLLRGCLGLKRVHREILAIVPRSRDLGRAAARILGVAPVASSEVVAERCTAPGVTPDRLAFAPQSGAVVPRERAQGGRCHVGVAGGGKLQRVRVTRMPCETYRSERGGRLLLHVGGLSAIRGRDRGGGWHIGSCNLRAR